MANILTTGIATLDIINVVASFPEEDSEVRAISQSVRRGGNAANTAVMLCQLGHQCTLASTLADDSAAEVILNDLKENSVACSHIEQIKNAVTPTSYISLNQKNASRTIVHYRDLPELQSGTLINCNLQQFDWVHFEGRNCEQIIPVLEHLKIYDHITCSIEIEKTRPEIESLFPFADYLIFSKNYCVETGFKSASNFIKQFDIHPGQTIIICWGDNGAFYTESKKEVIHIKAEPVDIAIDTIGAGDTFNAGFIHAICTGQSISQSIKFANKLAAFKIQQTGFDLSDFR